MQVVVELTLVDELRVVGVDWLDLDRHLQVGARVDRLVYLAEGALVDLPDNLEILPHFLKHLRHQINFKRKYIIDQF